MKQIKGSRITLNMRLKFKDRIAQIKSSWTTLRVEPKSQGLFVLFFLSEISKLIAKSAIELIELI